jgi:glycosyltransferase involved in cell wall biosynthesis
VKAAVICRTRNEARNIARFCEAHAWADVILIADGGSTDNTLDIARMYSNIRVRIFREKVYQNGQWRNPHGKHINFMIDWALEEGVDWIIFDDADCVPTIDLQRDIRGLLEDTQKDVVLLYRLYLWGHNQYFPDLNKPGQSLWGWHKDIPIRALDNDWSHDIEHCWRPEQELKLKHPHSCLHYFCPDEATVEQKLSFYRESGEIKGALHPLRGCGELTQLPDWARWRL